MDIEFHYYMTHLIALMAGFKPDDAFAIAYASQYRCCLTTGEFK